MTTLLQPTPLRLAMLATIAVALILLARAVFQARRPAGNPRRRSVTGLAAAVAAIAVLIAAAIPVGMAGPTRRAATAPPPIDTVTLTSSTTPTDACARLVPPDALAQALSLSETALLQPATERTSLTTAPTVELHCAYNGPQGGTYDLTIRNQKSADTLVSIDGISVSGRGTTLAPQHSEHLRPLFTAIAVRTQV